MNHWAMIRKSTASGKRLAFFRTLLRAFPDQSAQQPAAVQPANENLEVVASWKLLHRERVSVETIQSADRKVAAR
jgi:hypothetical protein